MSRTPSIAIDFTTLDRFSVGAGQYRYVVDLLRGLANLKPRARFVLFGSRTSPPVEVQDLFHCAYNDWEYFQLEPSTRKGAYFINQFRYAAALISKRIDLLHAVHGFVPLAFPAPVVLTMYDLMVDLFPEYRSLAVSRSRKRHRRAARFAASRLICISQCTADDVERLWHIPKSKIDVVLLGTELSLPAQGDEESRPVIVSPYNLEPRKNLMALLKAVALVRQEVPELRMILFGRAAITDVREADFEAALIRMGLVQSVVRSGFLPDKELKMLYSRSTLFVFPSLYEGFGLPVLEAMACGACVVARRASAMAEVVGDAGLLVETADVRKLVEAIKFLLDNPRRRSELRTAAHRRAHEFTIRKMAEGTLQTYFKALSAKHARTLYDAC